MRELCAFGGLAWVACNLCVARVVFVMVVAGLFIAVVVVLMLLLVALVLVAAAEV